MTKQNPAAAGPGEMARLNQQSFETVAHLHSRMIRDSLRFQAELLDFARRRVGKGVETQDRLARCHNVDEAARVVSDFCQTAMRDYGEEATGLMKLCVGMAAEQTEAAIAEVKGADEATGRKPG